MEDMLCHLNLMEIRFRIRACLSRLLHQVIYHASDKYDGPNHEWTDEENRMRKKALWYSEMLDKRKPPRAFIGEGDKKRALKNSTIKKSDLDRYGWDANPYVWVIKFKKCEKPEEWC